MARRDICFCLLGLGVRVTPHMSHKFQLHVPRGGVGKSVAAKQRSGGGERSCEAAKRWGRAPPMGF